MPPKRKRDVEEPANNSGTTQTSSDSSDWKWSKSTTLIYGDCGTKAGSKIVGFDMDDTLIKTKSGAKFPKDHKDWVFWHSTVPAKLREFHSKGFKVVIFTNQNGISKGHVTEKQIKEKIEEITKQLDIPIQTLIASADDSFRKPSKALWKFFTDNLNEKTTVDLGESIFCGDAAGRVKPKKDFNDTDLKFALNAGLKFMTPEESFLGEKQSTPKPEFDPKTLNKTGSIFVGASSSDIINPKGKDTKEMIIFVGSPASGKSTFWKNHLPSYVRVNRDTLKTKEKCLKVAEETIKKGENLVVDNTNPSKLDRKPFIDLAKKNGYDVRAFFFEIEKPLAFHLDTLREMNIYHKHFSGRVGSIPIHSFFKNVEKPETAEGFSEVKKVKFVAGPFDNNDDENIFFSFVTGKK